MDRVGNSFPFNAAGASQAYGRPMTVRPLSGPPNVDGLPQNDQNKPAGQIRPASPVETKPVEPKPTTDPSRLVAAKVDSIDLSRDVATIQGKATPAGSYPLYRHPADQNMAATGIEVGRSLDVQG
ncbi:MAG: hypothetical protein AB8F26_06020 [Phycisphaerales bacterium]